MPFYLIYNKDANGYLHSKTKTNKKCVTNGLNGVYRITNLDRIKVLRKKKNILASINTIL